jgi:TfoX/Sxy family transcriptional regulator of competence genes
MAPGSMPRSSDKAKAAFAKLVPDGPTVTMRPMFGSLSAFVNGNMFAGLFGEDLFLRLSEDDTARVRKQGGRDFEVMPGRAMRGYVTVPSGWHARSAATRAWIASALEFTAKMPPKAAGAKKAAPTRTARAR